MAQTFVGGTISTNTTWNATGNPYIVTDTITVNQNITLTINPGVIIKFNKNVADRFSMIVKGTLQAIGTEDSMITFTSNEFIPNFYDWGTIFFNESAIDYDFSSQTGCTLQFCKISYGGSYYTMLGYYLIVMLSSSAFIDHCIITNNGNTQPIYAAGCASEIRITNNKFLSVYTNSVPDMLLFLNDSSVDVSCNLFCDDQGYPAYSSGHLNFHHNLLVSNWETGFYVETLNNFYNNTVVDNQNTSSLIFLKGSIEHNTLTRNHFQNTGGLSDIVIYISDTNAKINGNNIYDQLPESMNSPLYEVGNYIQRQSYFNSAIDAANNWYNKLSDSEIDQIIYDYNDDTIFYEINYQPFLSSPDIIAPVTPPTGVTKTYLGGNNVMVSWNANPDADLAGYKIYWGSPTGYSFSNSIDVGNVTSYTLTNFFFNDTVAVTAYDADADGAQDQCEGHESWFTYDFMFTGIHSPSTAIKYLRCYPNPADQYTEIHAGDQRNPGGELIVRSSIGEIVKVLRLSSGKQSALSLSDLPSGVYQLCLTDEGSTMYYAKLAIVR